MSLCCSASGQLAILGCGRLPLTHALQLHDPLVHRRVSAIVPASPALPARITFKSLVEFTGQRVRGLALFVASRGAELPPAPHDFLIAPAPGDIRPGAQDQVDVIVQHGKIEHFDGAGTGEQFDSLLDPLFAVLEIFARDGVITAEESAAHTAVVAMKNTDFIGCDDLVSRAGRHK